MGPVLSCVTGGKQRKLYTKNVAGYLFVGTTVHRHVSDGIAITATAYQKQRLHKELFDSEAGWPLAWFDPCLIDAFRIGTDSAWKSIITEHIPGQVFSCNFFSDTFCRMFLEELEHFASTGLSANTMNNYGVVLNDIGFGPMIDLLQDNLLSVLSERQWKHILPFDGHHTFSVKYKAREDLGLDMHIDNSDVTFNINLGYDFTGAGLSFCGVVGHPDHRKHKFTYTHKPGRGCWHLGRLRHGADDIQTGERVNIIIWNHSSSYRESGEYKRPTMNKESGPPDKVCLSYTHDRDYGVFKAYSDKNASFQGRGSNPRPCCEYDGFIAEERQKFPFELND